MAIWQYSFWLLPEKKIIIEHNGFPHKSLSEDDFNLVCWFSHYSPERFLNSINYLPQGKHWHEDALLFGDYDTDSIAVLYEKNNILEIFCRIDMRGNYELMAKNMLNSVNAGSFVMVNEELEIFGKTYNALINEITFKQNSVKTFKQFTCC